MFHVEHKGGKDMQIEEIIKKHIGFPFGVCAFSCVSDCLLDCRAKERLPKNAKSIICFAVPYKVKDKAPENISRYAAVPDYHIVLKKRFHPLCDALKTAYPQNEFAFFTDNSPIPEVKAASLAGLGVIGKNGLLINDKYGSLVFLCEIVTDMAIKTTEQPAFCEDCSLCKKACPVGLCKTACLSAVTQKKQPLTPEEEEMISSCGSVWGCDICQDVCPHNKNAERTDVSEFLEGYRDKYTLFEDITDRAYAWRGEKVIKRNVEIIEKKHPRG